MSIVPVSSCATTVKLSRLLTLFFSFSPKPFVDRSSGRTCSQSDGSLISVKECYIFLLVREIIISRDLPLPPFRKERERERHTEREVEPTQPTLLVTAPPPVPPISPDKKTMTLAPALSRGRWRVTWAIYMEAVPDGCWGCITTGRIIEGNSNATLIS